MDSQSALHSRSHLALTIFPILTHRFRFVMAHRNLFFHFACSHRAPRAGSACRHRGMQHGLSRSTHQRQGSHGSGTGTRIHRDSSFPSPRQRRIDIITRGRRPTPPTCSTMPNNSAWEPGNTSSSQSNDAPIRYPE